MEQEKIIKIRKIADFGNRYEGEYLGRDFENRDLIRRNWWGGLQFLLRRSFYQGRRDAISEKVERRAMNVLKQHITPQTIGVTDGELQRIRNELRQVIGKGRVGRGRDIQMTVEIIQFASRGEVVDKGSLVEYTISKIERGEVEEHYKELDRIHSVGPKIASIYLRDVATVYSLEREGKIRIEDMKFFQPIDTWVRRVAAKIGIVEDNDKEHEIREKIVKECLEAKVSPIKFNEGAWFIGHNSFQLIIQNLDTIR